MKKIGNLIVGSVLVLLGVIFLLVNFSIIPDFSALEIFRNFWPLGLVLAGIFLIAKQRALAILFFVISILLGLFFLIVPSVHYEGNFEKIVEINSIELNNNITRANYDINFGGGEIVIEDTQNDTYLLQSSIESFDSTKPSLKYKEDGNKSYISMVRQDSANFEDVIRYFNTHDYSVAWDLKLNPKVESELDLNYGAADATLDLSKLNINYLNIECGASDTDIIFGNKSVDVYINSGAADFTLDFKEDIGIVVSVEGGLVDVNLEGFEKVGNKYYSPNYKEGNKNINIDIESGLTSISGGIKND